MGEDVPGLKRMTEPRSLKPAPDIVAGYRKVRPKRMWVGVAITAIILLIGVALIVSPPMSEKEIHIVKTIKPGWYSYIWVVLDKGERVRIDGTVSGGNDDIWIYIKDESGVKVKDFGKVRSPVHVVFTAPSNGNYTVYIDNTISVVTTKQVSLTLTKEYYDYTMGAIFLFLGLIGLLVDIVVLAIGQKRLVVKIGDEVYEFWPSNRGLEVSVNGMKLDRPLKIGDRFRIGPNDEHLLEIGKKDGRFYTWKWTVWIDDHEVGRLP